jgi:hypothetical protein
MKGIAVKTQRSGPRTTANTVAGEGYPQITQITQIRKAVGRKQKAEGRRQKTGSRKQEAGSRKQEGRKQEARRQEA